MNVYKNLAIQRIQGLYNDEQSFIPSIENQGLEWENPTKLFWGIDVDLENHSETVEYHSSAKFPHAGIGILRNYNCENREEHGLMGRSDAPGSHTPITTARHQNVATRRSFVGHNG